MVKYIMDNKHKTETDWVDDETMAPEETMKKFQALNPQPSSRQTKQ